MPESGMPESGMPGPSIAARLRAVRDRIAAACSASGRSPADVELVAVSKTHPARDVADAHAAGQVDFGENRVQELVAKAGSAELSGLALRWHLIGSLQTNKVRDVCRLDGLALVHSLDRIRLADALAAECERSGRRLRVLLQVDATDEPTKHGVRPDLALALAQHVRARCAPLELVGVMAIGPLGADPRPVFERVAALRAELAERLAQPLPVLSLGMTGDLEAAIAVGSTMVRVGTAVFGSRDRRAGDAASAG